MPELDTNDKMADKLKTSSPEKDSESKTKTQYTEISDPTIANEPATTYEIETHPFIIVTHTTLKEDYLKAESPFIKIITALNIPQAAKYLSTEIRTQTNSYDCIWCIGLDIETEKTLIEMKHNNILFSPDILSLQSNEQKKAMYTPLKKFISSNSDLISQL